MTSHDVVRQVRRLSDTRRVGHAGTLDPLATGVLVLALRRATRLLQYVVGRPKEYTAHVRFGAVSSTYDGEGEIISTGAVDVSGSQVAEALDLFRGEVEQVPPMYSALKKEGVPLYELARKGIEIEREARKVTIYEIELVDWEVPVAELKIVCSAGTYIRSLAHDLGQALGCGGYLAALRRTAIGPFTDEDAVPLEILTPETIIPHVQPMDTALGYLPALYFSMEEAERLAYGQRLPREKGAIESDMARAYDAAGNFVGIVSAEEGRWRPQKIFYHAAKG